MLFGGIDLGTQGVRVLVCDAQGAVQAEASVAFSDALQQDGPAGYNEQDAHAWHSATWQALQAALAKLAETGQPADAIAALSVTSTSGTLCLVDAAGEPVRPAIMYSDVRAAEEAAIVQAAGEEISLKLGSKFSASYAISRLVWLQCHEPQSLEAARWFCSPTDLVIGWLTGVWGVTDWTNALKTGYDVVDLSWPAFIGERLGLDMAKLPNVVAPGAPIAPICDKVSERSGLSAQTQVYAGATDGTASQLASGAAAIGEWNSTLGTTLVLKGVSEALIRDPSGRVYCHRHPQGYWLPGGASSAGADCIAQRFEAAQLDELNAAASQRTPTDLVVYPLARRGERFPFNAPSAEGFILGQAHDVQEYFTAHLEGIAYVERLAYQVVSDLGAQVGDTIYAVGGATQSAAGLQIRADVLGKVLSVPQVPSGAMGAAILAAAGSAFPNVTEAVAAMVYPAQRVEPRTGYAAAYEERYQRFVAACRERGYLA
ncbi:MAG: FGGY-family carbohydrate kinase [Chloroflexi bacterium]|nr:FGGY-family carbohydrate kinase [Chloroflexota bacterium]